MNKTFRQRVIISTEPQLIGAALGAWLAGRPGLDVVVDPIGSQVAGAGPNDVVIVSTPVDSEATVLVIGHDRLSVFGEGTVVDSYQNLDQLYSLIRERRGPPHRSTVQAGPPEGGGAP